MPKKENEVVLRIIKTSTACKMHLIDLQYPKLSGAVFSGKITC